ncbi:MAG: alpha/beta hydrolase [Oscillospiraceae bacterium]|nr:alpha/beta hydrolase [Oscillospiraceae bacterium]
MNPNRILLAVLILLTVLTLILPPFTTQIKHKNGGIGEKIFLDIGGIRQGMIIKGNDTEKPVLLFLSGGPGIPEYFLDHQYPTFLEDEFIVCFWDWRGTGLSYGKSVAPETMTREQFIADTFEVTEYLRKRFKADKIYLAAHSFGTSVGIQAIAERPELYSGYIAVSQIADQQRSEKLAYEYMLSLCKKEGNSALLGQLTDNPFGTESYFNSGVRDKAMHTLGVGTTRKMNSVITGIFFPTLRMTDYSLKERINIWRGKSFVNRTMQDTFTFNAFETVKSVNVPVYFFAGKYDYTCCYELQKEYFDFLEAPEKYFYTFENSAHSPLFEEPEKAEEIIKLIKSGNG